MAEILGATQVAQAAGQFAACGATFAGLLFEIHKYAKKNNSDRPCDELYDSTVHLIALMKSARDGAVFHEPMIAPILQRCIIEALALHELLGPLRIGPKDSKAIRYMKGLAWKRKEQKINLHCGRIERGKSELLFGLACIGKGMSQQQQAVRYRVPPKEVSILALTSKALWQSSLVTDLYADQSTSR